MMTNTKALKLAIDAAAKERERLDSTALFGSWAVFCEAALKYDRNAPPRYRAHTKQEAKRLSKHADRECQSKCKHPIKFLPNGGAQPLGAEE